MWHIVRSPSTITTKESPLTLVFTALLISAVLFAGALLS